MRQMITQLLASDTLGVGLAPLLAQAEAGTTDDGGTWLIIGLSLGALALLLFAIEIFVPTAGMIGILCGITAIASIISFFQHSSTAGGFALLVYLVATPFLFVYGVKLWSHSPIGRKLILGGTESVDGVGLDEEEVQAKVRSIEADERRAERDLIGRIAVTATPLRPVGVIRLDDVRRDALAESGVIEEGVEVEVVDVTDNQIKVRATSSPSVASE